MFKQIIVPLDASANSERALAYAEQLAKLTDAGLGLITTVIPIGPADAPEVAKLDDLARQRARLYLEKRAAAAREAGVSDVSFEVHTGDPADAIVQFAQARSADLIVMTTHGQGGDARYAFGSVALKVLSAAPCPIFLVRIEH